MRTRTRVAAALASSVLLAGTAVGLTTTTATAAAKPGKPAQVTVESGKGSYTVSWKKPKGKVARYQVADRAKAKGGWSAWKTKTVKKRTAKVKGKNGSLHQTRVRAGNAKGWSAWSKKAKVRIGLPSAVRATAAAGPKFGAATVTWPAAGANGAKVTGYDVRTKAGNGGWKTAKVGATTRTHAISGLADGQAVQAQVRAKNKHGAAPWSAVARTSAFPTPNPSMTVVTPGPYSAGDEVTVRFSGFPYDETGVNVALCANDGRPLQGPPDCAQFMGPASKLVAPVKGVGQTTITMPEGPLGNTNAPAVDCSSEPGACAIVVATVYSSKFTVKVAPVAYVDPVMSVSNPGPYTGGEQVTVTYSGFHGSESQINVAVCAMDGRQLGGPDDCAPLSFEPDSANTVVTPKNGAGTATITLPNTELGNVNGPALDCADGDCMLMVTTLRGHPYAFVPLVYET